MGKLDGKSVIVTGASRGIGQCIAQLFADEGARVVCAARTVHDGDHQLEGSLSRTVERIREKGGEAHAVAVDISKPENCIGLVEQARALLGPIDVLVNNAALTYYVPIEDFRINRWIKAFEINVHAPFILSQAVLVDMTGGRGGAIVNISSGAAMGPGRGPYEDTAVRGSTMYGAGKAALERFTQGLAQEVAHYRNITVAAVSPSQTVPTPGTVFHKLMSAMDDPRGESPSVMARAALLLASAPPEKVNGRVSYSQLILKEFGWIDAAVGRGIDSPGSGFSQI